MSEHTDKNGETPRVDALTLPLGFDVTVQRFHMLVSLARQLERELAAMTENAILKDQAIERHLAAQSARREHDPVKALADKLNEADAARYRFWREHWTAESEDKFDKLNDILGKTDVNTPRQVDAALDAAIEADQQRYVPGRAPE